MSQTDNKMIKRGAIIKVPTTIIFDETTKRRNKAPWVYGVVDFLEDVCEETKERSWSIDWACEHIYIVMESYSHLCGILETDLTLVRMPGEDDIKLDKYYTTDDFLKNRIMENGR